MLSPSRCCWLELRSGAPAQCTSFLLEHFCAYEVFDRPEPQPRMVIAIGGREKQRFLESQLGGAIPQHGGSITLRALAPSTIVVDCEMHNVHTLPRLKAGPPTGEHLRHHLLLPPDSQHQIARFVQELYSNVLFPFASVVLLFLEDLGGLVPVVDILATWARRSMLSPMQSPPPRVLILHRETGLASASTAEFEARLDARLTAILRDLGLDSPLHSLSAAMGVRARTKAQWQASFARKAQLLPVSAPADVLGHVEQSFQVRVDAGFAFRGTHLKHLVREAVYQFGQGRHRPLDFYSASRLRNPLPEHLTEHVVNFVGASQSAAIDQARVIASALDLDAHPPGMHCEQTHKKTRIKIKIKMKR